MARDPVPAEDQGVSDVPIPVSETEVKPRAPSATLHLARGEQVPAQAVLACPCGDRRHGGGIGRREAERHSQVSTDAV